MNKWILLMVLFAFTGQVLAYKTVTHGKLAEISAEGSNLYQAIQHFGFSSTQTFPNAFGDPMTPRKLMSFGAHFEDGCGEIGTATQCGQDSAYPNGENAVNHFYDPQKGGEGLPLCTKNAASSADWALEDLGQIGEQRFCEIILPVITTNPQQYSYEDGVAYFRHALTSPSQGARNTAAGRMFQTFGHIAHHLHDMAQPQHVREDKHCDTLACMLINQYQPSVLESVAKESDVIDQCISPWVHNRSNIYGDAPLLAGQYPRYYWNTTGNKGMAEFTAKNFVSVGTNFEGDIKNPQSTHAEPTPDFSDPKWRTEVVDIEDMMSTTCLKSVNPQYNELEGKLTFITHDITDPYNNKDYNDLKISTYSIFTNDLQQKHEVFPDSEIYTPIFSMNPFNYEDIYRVALPRAVEWIDGLINYFYRGKLDVSVVDKTITVKNVSGMNMDGSLSIYYEDANHNRSLLTTTAASLAHNQTKSITITDTPTPSAGFNGKYIAVFDGQIGAYKGLAAQIFDGPYVQPTPCGSSLSFSGGTGEESRLAYELGETSGRVYIEFEAYQIPDSFTVKTSGGKTLQSAEVVQGYNVYQFDHNPSSDGSTVDVTVTGNDDPGTAWEFAMGCPGGSPGTLPRVDVQFIADASLSVNCSVDLYVDGQKLGSFKPNGRIYAKLTPGTNHYYEYRNFRSGLSDSCSYGLTDNYWSVTYYDNAGEHVLRTPMLSHGNRYFTVQ